MGNKKNLWEKKDYDSKIESEWFCLGMIDPAQFNNKADLDAAIDHEWMVKNRIYEIRNDDAEKNKFDDDYYGIKKYRPGYAPIPWEQAEATAFAELGRPNYKYMYSPLDTPNIDDYYFDWELADTWCLFLEKFIPHIEGHLGNQLILLTCEQRAFYRNLFGWKNKKTGLRRYREIFKYIPRKNSKTFDLSALAIGCLIINKEPGAKIISVANSLAQSHYAFDPARLMLEKDKELKISNGELAAHFSIQKTSITANLECDVFKPIAFSERSTHGGNFYVSIMDEIHEMVDDSIYGICKTSQGARLEPLIVMISTAGTCGESLVNRKLDQAKKVCRNIILNDRFLPILYYSNPDEFKFDNWHDVNLWRRTNPMYGIAKTKEYLKDLHQDGIDDPPFENTFKRLDLNWITESLVSAFNSVDFNKCAQDMTEINHTEILKQKVPRFLLGQKCYPGLDLAGKNDLCALTLDFPNSNWILSWSFSPAKNNKIKNKDRFVKELITCGDEIIDFKDLREQLIKIMSYFDIIELGFDSRFATELIQHIEEECNIETCEVPQSAKYVNEPIRQIQDDIRSHKIKHNGSVIFSWQLSNCQLKEDAHNCYMIQKQGSNSPSKIDAIAAWVNARAMNLHNPVEQTLTERYKKEGHFFTFCD